MSISDSDKESIKSSSSKEGKVLKLGSGELYNFNNIIVAKIKTFYLNLDDYINANHNYEFFQTCLVNQSHRQV